MRAQRKRLTAELQGYRVEASKAYEQNAPAGVLAMWDGLIQVVIDELHALDRAAGLVD